MAFAVSCDAVDRTWLLLLHLHLHLHLAYTRCTDQQCGQYLGELGLLSSKGRRFLCITFTEPQSSRRLQNGSMNCWKRSLLSSQQ